MSKKTSFWSQPESRLCQIRFSLLLAFAPIMFFSYYPLLLLGSSDTMNLELSLPLIWLVIYDLFSLLAFIPLFRRHGLKNSLRGLSDLKFFLFSLFPLFLTASVLWSSNLPRAALTAGLAWALFIAIFASYELFVAEPQGPSFQNFWLRFKKILYFSTAIVCLFCWIQCILDLSGLPRTASLLCPGCTYQLFGFPHPNGFAIEPQFMGNLLLAPIIILLLDIIYHHKFKSIPLLFFFLVTLFIVFSRGAIYAFGIAFLVILIYRFIKTKSFKPLASLALVLVAFLFALFAQGLMSELSPTTDNFSSGIAKSIHQLSLGKIDFRSTTPVEPVENPVENSDSNSSSFDGYVAESTDIRLHLSEYALQLWHQSPANLFLGVGIGSAGVALNTAFPDEYSPKEIIQNEYASLALELGLVGLAFLGLSLVLSLRRVFHSHNSPAKLLFISLLLAYAVSLCFFSGLTNALHIYLLLALALINVI